MILKPGWRSVNEIYLYICRFYHNGGNNIVEVSCELVSINDISDSHGLYKILQAGRCTDKEKRRKKLKEIDAKMRTIKHNSSDLFRGR